ncbi:hypothetical protein NDU88_000961 [Pleurodeles waltl]|uniref:Uncharacterized protein n=1 Tax=Pleurodeles waltl TaxID=8319 RepID=A0AAV7LEJ0_PLEWA|nr:hypothetical protein NDU88_000961 [Pleurodeles waltl]
MASLYPDSQLFAPERALQAPYDTTVYRLTFFQIRAAARSQNVDFPTALLVFQALELLYSAQSLRRLIISLYLTTRNEVSSSPPVAREKLEQDLAMLLSDDKWKYCCAHIHAFTPNYQLWPIHLKILHRIYHTPVRLHRMGLRADAAAHNVMLQTSYILPGAAQRFRNTGKICLMLWWQ